MRANHISLEIRMIPPCGSETRRKSEARRTNKYFGLRVSFGLRHSPFGFRHSLPFPAEIFVSPDRKSTRLNSSHVSISYAVFCLKKKKLERSQLVNAST